jgi:hypothetical protein
MTDDDECNIRGNRSMKEQKIYGGRNRRYFIYRLRKKGLHRLAARVIKHEISANAAAISAGLIARQTYTRL